MRLNTSPHFHRLVLALAMFVSAQMASATDTIDTAGIGRFSYGDWFITSDANAVRSAVVGTQPIASWAGNYSYWQALMQFAIPAGVYSAATLTFSTSPYAMFPNMPNPSDPAIRVGLFDLVEVPFAFDYTKDVISLSTGTAYGSVDMRWPTSFTIPVSQAVGDINSAAGGWFSVVFKPLETASIQAAALPRLASIENAILQLTPAVPEPGEWAMLLAGLVCLGFMVRARRV